MHQATLEAISQTESFYGKYDIVIQLMPNCPLRNKHCEDSLKFFLKIKIDLQFLFKYEWMDPWWAHRWKGKNFKIYLKTYYSSALKIYLNFFVLLEQSG